MEKILMIDDDKQLTELVDEFLSMKKYTKGQIWSIDSARIVLIRYQSNNYLIQDLPLLFMILKGSLTFVVSQMVPVDQSDPKLILKPGVTGLQHLKSDNIRINSIKEFENYYAIHYSFVFDIEIILKSIFRI